MDMQTIVNLGLSVGMGAMGWFARELWDTIKLLQKDMSHFREEIAKDYVRKDALKEAMIDLKDMLIRIDTKLDKKMDK